MSAFDPKRKWRDQICCDAQRQLAMMSASPHRARPPRTSTPIFDRGYPSVSLKRASRLRPSCRVTTTRRVQWEFVSLSVLVLEPVAVRGLFGAIAADRHAAPSSRLHPRMVGKYQGAPMPFTSFNAGEIFFTHEPRQCLANRQQ